MKHPLLSGHRRSPEERLARELEHVRRHLVRARAHLLSVLPTSGEHRPEVDRLVALVDVVEDHLRGAEAHARASAPPPRATAIGHIYEPGTGALCASCGLDADAHLVWAMRVMGEDRHV